VECGALQCRILPAEDVSIGDAAIVYFENVRYNYVTDSKIVDPTEVPPLVDSQKVPDETLILQTCCLPARHGSGCSFLQAGTGTTLPRDKCE
jgi:hypothetical protein